MLQNKFGVNISRGKKKKKNQQREICGPFSTSQPLAKHSRYKHRPQTRAACSESPVFFIKIFFPRKIKMAAAWTEHEALILDQVARNDVTVIVGTAGSGKSSGMCAGYMKNEKKKN
jgi:hypothetical protein